MPPTASPVTDAGTASDVVTAAASDGPALLTVIVQATGWPCCAGFGLAADFTIERSAEPTTVSVSVTVPVGLGSVVPAGSVAVTALVTEPLVAVTFAFTVKVSDPPEGNVATVTPLSKLAGVTVGHTALPAATQLTAVLVRPVAAGSVTTVPLAVLGPLLVSTIV